MGPNPDFFSRSVLASHVGHRRGVFTNAYECDTGLSPRLWPPVRQLINYVARYLLSVYQFHGY